MTRTHADGTLSESSAAARHVKLAPHSNGYSQRPTQAKGRSNKEIAGALGISDQTVKNHITALLRKLGVVDRTQAVLLALRRGWIGLAPPAGG